MDKKKQPGFTLIELLVTVALVAVLAAVAVPSFAQLVQNNRLTAKANELLSSLAFARGEAVRLRTEVRVRAASGGTDWEGGWLVYVDADADGAPDSAEVLRSWPALRGDNTLRAGSAELVFDPLGSAGAAASLVLCDSRGASKGRQVAVSATGRPTVGAVPGGVSCTT